MQCQQCGGPPFYKIGEGKGVILCLSCYERYAAVQNTQFLYTAAMANQALADMEMVTGISLGGDRFPVAAMAKAIQGQGRRVVYNNITVTGSTIGVINTGDLARIDAAITATKATDIEAVGEQIKAVTQAVIDSQETDADFKREMVELIQSLATQLEAKERKRSVILALLTAIEDRAKGVVAIASVVKGLSAAIVGMFAGYG